MSLSGQPHASQPLMSGLRLLWVGRQQGHMCWALVCIGHGSLGPPRARQGCLVSSLGKAYTAATCSTEQGMTLATYTSTHEASLCGSKRVSTHGSPTALQGWLV